MKKLAVLLVAASAMYAECPFLPVDRPCIPSKGPNDQTDVYTEISFLYWEALEKGLDFALKNTQTQYDEKATVHEVVFNFEPACRLKLGTYLPDGWKIDATWSFFFHTIEANAKDLFDTTATPGPGLIPVWTSPGAFNSDNVYARWEYANTEWKLHANFVDLLLRTDLLMSPGLGFEPAFGVKMAILQQRFNVAYLSGNTINVDSVLQDLSNSTIHMTNRSLNIGPEVGCALTWHITRRWNVLGSLSGALLGSRFTVGRNEYDASDTVTGSYRNNYNFWTYRPQASMRLGFQWTDCIPLQGSGRLRFAIGASYEAQCWWKQNMMLRHYDAPTVQSHTLTSTVGDLFFHGLDIDFLFDF